MTDALALSEMKLSSLIRMAVRDAKLCEQDDRFVIDMGAWMATSLNGKCHVCMAGAVLAQTFKYPMLPIGKSYSPNTTERYTTMPERYVDLDEPARTIALIINNVRGGYLLNAFFLHYDSRPPNRVDLDRPSDRIQHNLTPSGAAPWHIYEGVADDLEKLGY